MIHWTPIYKSCPELIKEITNEKEAREFLQELNEYLLNNNGVIPYEKIINYIYQQPYLGYQIIPFYMRFTEKTPLPYLEFTRYLILYSPFEELPKGLLEMIIQNAFQIIKHYERKDTLDDHDRFLNELFRIITQAIIIEKSFINIFKTRFRSNFT